MANAYQDENRVFSKLAVLNTDSVQGTNLVNIKVDSNGLLNVDPISVISFTMQPVSPKDENYRDCWLFEGTDGLTYPAVATSAGAILIST
jgi:hypothetical protein